MTVVLSIAFFESPDCFVAPVVRSLRSLPTPPWALAVDKTTLRGPRRNSRRRFAPLARLRRAVLSEGRRLVDQHDRDIVADGVAKPACVANEHGLGRTVLEFALAFRADEDGEQLLMQCHVARS